MNILLSQHTIATVNRCKKESIVLAAQDTTSLNYSAHPATANIGPIGSSQDGPIGLLVHDTMAFNLEGVPLGLLDVQCWARNPDDFGKKAKRHTLPIEEKESYKWLKSYEKVVEAQLACPDTMFISVGDREADIYELFALASANQSAPELLVRAKQDRTLDDTQAHLWQHLESLESTGIQEIHVPRQKNRPARIAELEVRFAEVALKPPSRKQNLALLPVWAVFARETNPPENVEPLEWMLLTTCPVTNFAQAVEKLDWYAKRWGIEVYHRTLKSGCKIEERQLGHAERIESCLAIDMVVAWRIHHLTQLGREAPDVPCTVFFEEAEWRALIAYKKKIPHLQLSHQRFVRRPEWLPRLEASSAASAMASQAPKVPGSACNASTTSPVCGRCWLNTFNPIATHPHPIILLMGKGKLLKGEANNVAVGLRIFPVLSWVVVKKKALPDSEGLLNFSKEDRLFFLAFRGGAF